MTSTKTSDFSKLEKALSGNLTLEANEQFAQIRETMRQMADKQSKQIVVSSYPACNSII